MAVEESNSTDGERTLDYAGPRSTSEKPRSGWVSSGMLIGLIVTPPALLLAVLSAFTAGAGHGDAVITRLLFPLPLLGTLFTHNDSIAGAITIAGLLQFPLYGVVVGYGLSRRRMTFVAAVLLIHTAAVIGCFSIRF